MNAFKKFQEFLDEEANVKGGDFWLDNIDRATVTNEDYRKVLFTGESLQLVLMNLKPGVEIGSEVHEHGDQFLRVEEGSGKVVLDGNEMPFDTDDAVVIPAGTQHNIINTGEVDLKLYVIYGPPEHAEGLVQTDKPND